MDRIASVEAYVLDARGEPSECIDSPIRFV